MWSYHLKCIAEQGYKEVSKRQKGISGQTYMEVVVSLAVLMLILPMVYKGLQVGETLQKQGTDSVWATYKSEAILGQVLKTLETKGMPTEEVGDFMAYLATSTYTKPWLEKEYNTTSYRYDLAYVPTTNTKEEGVLMPLDAAACKYVSTEPTSKEEMKTLFKAQNVIFKRGDTVPIQQGGAAVFKLLIKSLSPFQASMFPYFKDIQGERVYVTLGRETMDTVTYDVTSQEKGDLESHRKNHLRSPIVLQLDARGLANTSAKRMEVTNYTAFPVVVQSLTTGEHVLQVTGISVGGGRITTCTNQQNPKGNYGCMLLVTQKEGDTLKVIKKQIMAIPY